MSIADEIRNMNNTFLSTKTQETLKEMPLEKLAENWLAVDSEVKKNAQNADGSLVVVSLYQKNKKEVMNKLTTIITSEQLKNKLDNYLVSLTMNNFDAADFHGVLSFLDDYSASSDKDGIKNQIESIKNKISTKKLNVEKPLDLNISKDNLGYTGVNIEANKEIVNGLSNPKNPAGKTLTFRNKQGKDVAGIEFDKEGNMDILIPDENGMALHYQLKKDGKFLGETNDQSMHLIDPNSMPPAAKQAYDFAKEAENIWNDYADGKLDDKIAKNTPVTINEGAEQEGVNVNENESEIEINQDTRQSTKVNEFNPLVNMIDPTKINEGESLKPDKKNEADVNGDDLDQPTHRPDEVYWKEGDVIDTMFMWLVDGANAATNFVVHRIEDVACGIWAQLHRELIEQKAEKEKTANSTQKLKKELTMLHNSKLCNIEKTCDKKNINKLLEQGNIQTILDQHPAFAVLYEKIPHLQQLMTPKHLVDEKVRKEAASIISSTITNSETFSHDYALASMMDEKIKDKSAFNTLNEEQREAIYNERRKEGITVFLQSINHDFQKKYENAGQDKNAMELLSETLDETIKKIKKANKNNNKAIKNEKYDEKNQIPDANVALFHFQKFAPQKPDSENTQTPPDRTQNPRNLREEARDSARRDAEHDSRRDDVSQEEAANEADKERNRERREEFDRRRNNINGSGNERTNQETQEARNTPIPRPRGNDGR